MTKQVNHPMAEYLKRPMTQDHHALAQLLALGDQIELIEELQRIEMLRKDAEIELLQRKLQLMKGNATSRVGRL